MIPMLFSNPAVNKVLCYFYTTLGCGYVAAAVTVVGSKISNIFKERAAEAARVAAEKASEEFGKKVAIFIAGCGTTVAATSAYQRIFSKPAESLCSIVLAGVATRVKVIAVPVILLGIGRYYDRTTAVVGFAQYVAFNYLPNGGGAAVQGAVTAFQIGKAVWDLWNHMYPAVDKSLAVTRAYVISPIQNFQGQRINTPTVPSTPVVRSEPVKPSTPIDWDNDSSDNFSDRGFDDTSDEDSVNYEKQYVPHFVQEYQGKSKTFSDDSDDELATIQNFQRQCINAPSRNPFDPPTVSSTSEPVKPLTPIDWDNDSFDNFFDSGFDDTSDEDSLNYEERGTVEEIADDSNVQEPQIRFSVEKKTMQYKLKPGEKIKSGALDELIIKK